jgi:Na+-transporting methylmalonyl-CoA/oxaloacetate decarboxylase beta subunit
MNENQEIYEVKMKEKRELEKYEKIGWGLFLVMLGAIWLFPDSIVPEGTFMFGVGIILLGINFVKYTKGYRVNGFTIFLGVVALVAGLSNLLGHPVDIFPLILILWGVSIIFGIGRKRKKRDL